MSVRSDLKPRVNRRVYVEALRRMTPEERLLKACELTDLSRQLLRDGIRTRFPEATEEEVQALYLERIERCRKRNS